MVASGASEKRGVQAENEGQQKRRDNEAEGTREVVCFCAAFGMRSQCKKERVCVNEREREKHIVHTALGIDAPNATTTAVDTQVLPPSSRKCMVRTFPACHPECPPVDP